MPVMAHLVLGYPTLAESLRTAETYIRAGVQVLELQIPFSHPTADGPVITAACREAVRQGVTVRDYVSGVMANPATARDRVDEGTLVTDRPGVNPFACALPAP